jgi:hypothetical protein
MRLFTCACGSTVFFENTTCLNCRRDLGYLPDRRTMSSLEPTEEAELYRVIAEPEAAYRKCRNYSKDSVCNWMVPATEASPYCIACRLNEVIPSLDQPENRARWASIEGSKRRLVYSLLELDLPVRSKGEDPEHGLGFAFLANPPSPASGEPEPPKVMTGHNQGLITINISEADEIERELTRRQMHEAYRTLLGHFRHESGHYYWKILVADTPTIEAFRNLFGDERQDYDASLQQHYSAGPPADWQTRFISSYASSHPWEDWAETWAHYLHIVDTLETARAFGVTLKEDDAQRFPAQPLDVVDDATNDPGSFGTTLQQWVWLSLAINSMNRSMGMRDPYPFVLSKIIADKLQLVHRAIRFTHPDA